MPKLLIVSPTPTHPTNPGNRARIRKWLELYTQVGIDFHFAFFRQEPGDEAGMAECWGEERCTFLEYQLPHRRYTIPQRLRLRLAKALGRQHVVPYGIDDWRCNLLVRDLRKLADRIKPSCVLVEYVFYSHLFDCFDRSVLKVLDTHDIVAGRQKMS